MSKPRRRPKPKAIPCLSCGWLVTKWLRGANGADRCPHCRYDQYESA